MILNGTISKQKMKKAEKVYANTNTASLRPSWRISFPRPNNQVEVFVSGRLADAHAPHEVFHGIQLRHLPLPLNQGQDMSIGLFNGRQANV